MLSLHANLSEAQIVRPVGNPLQVWLVGLDADSVHVRPAAGEHKRAVVVAGVVVGESTSSLLVFHHLLCPPHHSHPSTDSSVAETKQGRRRRGWPLTTSCRRFLCASWALFSCIRIQCLCCTCIYHSHVTTQSLESNARWHANIVFFR